ncbi:unnamed protein product [Chrysoparadoxa australica]
MMRLRPRSLQIEAGDAGARRHLAGCNSGVLVAALANLSISYNVVSVSLALEAMKAIYPENTSAIVAASSSIIGGMVVGQLLFGRLGDYISHHRALALTLCVCGVGALGSSLLRVDGFHIMGSIFGQLAAWRFVLGVGAGGVYPLGAIMAKESSSGSGSTAVALVFSMQGIGYMLSPLMMLLLLTLMPHQGSIWLVWRIQLGIGCVPVLATACLVMLVERWDREASQLGSRDEPMLAPESNDIDHQTGPLAEDGYLKSSGHNICLWPHLKKLLGTGGSWFLFDLTFYSNTLFEPEVLESAFSSSGTGDALMDTAWKAALLSFISAPGYAFAVILMGKIGARRIQLQGLLMMSLLYLAIGLSFSRLRGHPVLMVALYGATFFFSNFGPNSTTFVLPSITFPPHVRSSLNGVSAACGKGGALLGALAFEPLSAAVGSAPVIAFCGGISCAAFVLTYFLVHPHDSEMLALESSDSGGAFHAHLSPVGSSPTHQVSSPGEGGAGVSSPPSQLSMTRRKSKSSDPSPDDAAALLGASRPEDAASQLI